MRKNAIRLFLGVLVICCAAPSAMADIRKDLVLYFSCDKKIKNGFIKNESPGPGLGQVIGAVSRVPGLVGEGACRFDSSGPTPSFPTGKEAYIRVKNKLEDPKRSLNVGFGNDAEFTLAAWYNATNDTDEYTNQSPLIEWGEPTFPSLAGVHFWAYTLGGQWQGQGTGANLVDVNGNDSSFIISTNDQTRGQWHHLVVTFKRTDDSAEARVYVDGTLRNTRVFDSPPAPNTVEDVYIGRRPWDTQRFRGDLDDIRIYRRAITDQEVLELFNLGA